MKKRRFTWLDGIICAVLILAVVGGAVWYLTKDDAPVVPLQEYDVTLRFDRQTTQPFDYYEIGDTLYYQNRTGEIGTIVGLKDIERRFEDYDEENGRYVVLVDPNRRAVEMTVRVKGAVIDGKFTVNGKYFHIGEVFYPQSDTTRSSMTVWDIEEVQP